MGMLNRPAEWFRNVMAGGAVVSLAMVPATALLLHGSLPLWLHIPLVGVALLLMAGGAVVAGAAAVEFRARSGQAARAE